MSQPSHIANPVVTIEAASPSEHSRFIQKVITGVTRSRMQAISMLFSPLFGSAEVRFSPKIGASPAEAALQLVSGATPASLELTRDAFAALFANPDNVRKAYCALPSGYKVVIDAILDQIFVSANFIKITVDTNLQKVRLLQRNGSRAESYATAERLSEILQRIGSTYRTDCLTLEMPILYHIGQALRKGLFADTAPLAVETLPDDGELRSFSCADQYISMIGIIKDAYRKGELAVTSTTGVVKPTQMKMFALSYPTEEFFPAAPVRQMRDMRLRMMLSFVNAAPNRQMDFSQPSAELLAKMHSQTRLTSYGFFALSLPWIGGLRKSLFDNCDYSRVYREILSFFRDRAEKATPGPWYDAQVAAKKIFVRLPNSLKFGFNITSQDFTSYDLTNGADNTEIKRINIVSSVGLPGLLGIMVNMCATGLLDMAVSAPKAEATNPLECVRYVRLSAFGRYAFGIDGSYTPELVPVATQVQCELDPDRLIITALSSAAVNAVRTNFGIAIGAGRFEVTPESIFRKAPDAHSLSLQKERLLTLAGLTELPPLWEDFFKSIKHRYNAIAEKSITKDVYYEINPACPGLAEAITSDPDIRKLIRLVEGNAFLVSRDDVRALRSMLKDHGYLLPEPRTHYYYY